MDEQMMDSVNKPAAPGRFASFGSRAAALGGALLLGACASFPPPTDQMAVSTAAVAHAVSAGGSQLAPLEMRSAQEKLERANVAMTGKYYNRAATLAQEAQVDAQLAEAKSHAIQSRKAADELQEADRVLREETDRNNKQSPAPRT
jgi:Domain of unknown function (DUF4398)